MQSKLQIEVDKLKKQEEYVSLKIMEFRTCPAYWKTPKSLQEWKLDEFARVKCEPTLIQYLQNKIINETCIPQFIGIGQDSHKMTHIKGFVLRNAERIEHGVAWKRYKDRRIEISMCKINDKISTATHEDANDHLVKTFGLEIACNERFLFHGTKPDVVDLILNQGFTEHVGNLQGMFGSGIYFSENSSKSDEYCAADSKGLCYMFLTRVCLGAPYVVRKKPEIDPLKGIRRAPFFPGMDPKLKSSQAHSVVAETVMSKNGSPDCYLQRYREFVVYNGAQCYPEILLTFERTTQTNPKPNVP